MKPELQLAQSQVQSLSQSQPASASSLRLHPLHSRYAIVREIGHGAQGRLYLARRLSDNKNVVIKQLNISSIKSWKSYELFHREAEVLESLHIPGVARFYDAVDCLDGEPPCSYIVQEYIEGVSLQKMIKDGHRFRMDDVYEILIQTLTILDKLHHHEPPVIHRDIKPSNLMITADYAGKLKVTIIDFGAVANPQVQGGGSTVAGTFGYMPPEQLTGKPVPASDVYALGALAVQLFCGKSPADLPQKDFRLIFEPELEDKPHDLVVLLGQMLDPKVDQRLSDIPEIIRRLRDVKAGKILALDTQQSARYTSVFEKRLSEVRTIGQSGNIEIWQQLPDDTPRLIPDYYGNIISKYSSAIRLFVNKKFNIPMISNKIFNNEQRISSIIGFSIKLCKVFLASLCISAGIVGAVIWVSKYFGLNKEIIWLTACVCLSLLGCMFLIMVGGLLISLVIGIINQFLNVPVSIKEQMIVPNRFGVTAEYLVEQMHNLLRNGRKTIARIHSVEYLPQKNVEIIHKSYNDPNKGRKQAVFLANKPLFKVLYNFNPPDDKREKDIIHSFITQAEPENHYKPGDPLPILYYIDSLYFCDDVTSMPFPLSELDLNEHMAGMIVDSSTGEDGVSGGEAQNNYLPENHAVEPENHAVEPENQAVEPENQAVEPENQAVEPDNHAVEPENQAVDLPKDLCLNIDVNTDIRKLFRFPMPDTGHDDLNKRLNDLIQAKTISGLNEVLCLCYSDKVRDNLKMIPYLEAILMEPRVCPCHKTCIQVLTKMAFPEFFQERCPEAFDVIIRYMKSKPRHLTEEICMQINLIKYFASAERYKDEVSNEFYDLLLDIISDRTIIAEARTEIAKDFWYLTPKRYQELAYNIIKNLDDKMIINRGEILNALNDSITESSISIMK